MEWMQGTAATLPPDCTRLHDWLVAADARPEGQFPRAQTPPVDAADANSEAAAAADGAAAHDLATLHHALHRLASANRPLVWLESTDVQTARAAVRLAQQLGATVHVAGTGAGGVRKAVIQNDGWLGCSLADVSAHAEFLLHVGTSHLRELPLLASRFFQPLQQHAVLGPDAPASVPVAQHFPFPRDSWLELLTLTLLQLRAEPNTSEPNTSEPNTSEPNTSEPKTSEPKTSEPEESSLMAAARDLAAVLRDSSYSVVLWGEDELSTAHDQLLVRRLLEITRCLSETTRASLLMLESDPGKNTAQDVVLWLTNCAATVRFHHGGWQAVEATDHFTLDDWRREYDWIVCVRALPSVQALPAIDFDWIIDTCHSSQPSGEAQRARRVAAAAVGLEVGGHVTRGDHGQVCYLPPLPNRRYSQLPTASQWLERLQALRQQPAGADA
jgi:hypothetical protein